VRRRSPKLLREAKETFSSARPAKEGAEELEGFLNLATRTLHVRFEFRFAEHRFEH